MRRTKKPAKVRLCRTKLTAARVIAARKLYRESFANVSELAVVCDVSVTTMGAALAGRTWKHLDENEPPCEMRARSVKPTRMLTIDGITRPVWMWAEDNNIDERLVRQRLDAGWNPVDALTLPNLGQGGHNDRRQRITA